MITLIMFFLVTYILYRVVYYYPVKCHVVPREIPDDELYGEHQETMLLAIDDMENADWKEVSIQSDGGVVLAGRYLLTRPSAPLVIFMHGYHGTYKWDGYGCYKMCKKLGYNLLMVDERAHGDSAGHTITFGIKEQKDCLKWIEFANSNLDYSKLYLWGVSMGASTVLMAASHLDRSTVSGIISECAYTSPEAIIRRTAYTMKVPGDFLAPGIKAAARIWGHFNLTENSSVESVKKTDIPVLFIHGTGDGFVPVKMCEILYNACVSDKEIAYIEGSKHAVCALTDISAYRAAVESFLRKY